MHLHAIKRVEQELIECRIVNAVRSRSISKNGKFGFIIEYIDSVKLLIAFSHNLTYTHKLNLEGVGVCREE